MLMESNYIVIFFFISLAILFFVFLFLGWSSDSSVADDMVVEWWTGFLSVSINN